MVRCIAWCLVLGGVLLAASSSNSWAQDLPFDAASDTICTEKPGDKLLPPTERIKIGPDTLRLSAESKLRVPGYVQIADTTAIRLNVRDDVEIVLRKPPCAEDPSREIDSALYEITESTLRIIRGIAVVDGKGYNVRLGDGPEPVSIGSRVAFFVDDSKDLYLFYLRKGRVSANDTTFTEQGQLARFDDTWEPISPDSVGLTAAWLKNFTDHSLAKLWNEKSFWKKPIFIGGAAAFVIVTSCVFDFIICDGDNRPNTGGVTIPLPNP